MIEDLEEKHRVICSQSARIIVFDQAVWIEYKKGANDAFLNRAKGFPDARPAVPQYAPGFYQRFGAEMTEDRGYKGSGIQRSDISILKDGQLIATFVDFIVYMGGIDGGGLINCTGLYPELYLKDLDINE